MNRQTDVPRTSGTIAVVGFASGIPSSHLRGRGRKRDRRWSNETYELAYLILIVAQRQWKPFKII